MDRGVSRHTGVERVKLMNGDQSGCFSPMIRSFGLVGATNGVVFIHTMKILWLTSLAIYNWSPCISKKQLRLTA